MADIGILTYHNNSNRGAILQAYCLWDAVNRMFPDRSVEIIDYRTLSKEFKRLYAIDPRKIYNRLRDYRTATKFYDRSAELSNERQITNSHSKAVQFIDGLDYELIFVGSDVVWRRVEDSARPFPNAYFLDPSIEAATASYAASANKTTEESLGDELETFREHIQTFDQISVRDRHTESFLRSLGIDSVRRVPDPTILVDIPEPPVERKLRAKGVDLDAPLLGLHTQSADLFKSTAERFQERGYQVVSPIESPIADVSLFADLEPFEYFSMYAHFDMVVTESFHSTIFSLLHGVPFATVDVAPGYEGVQSKTESLLADFELLDRHVDAVNANSSEVSEYVKELEYELDKSWVESRKTELRQEGMDYIKDVRSSLLNEGA